jgi:hypothetical protein
VIGPLWSTRDEGRAADQAQGTTAFIGFPAGEIDEGASTRRIRDD